MIESAVALVMMEGLTGQFHDFLALKRREDAHFGGRWSLPGGRLEAGETHSQAVVREAKEETGYRIRVLMPMFDTFTADKGTKYHVQLFLARVTGGEPRQFPTEEHDAMDIVNALTVQFEPGSLGEQAMEWYQRERR